jgi:hypothetical protein
VFQVWVNFVVKGLAVDAGPTPARTRGVPALDHEILHHVNRSAGTLQSPKPNIFFSTQQKTTETILSPKSEIFKSYFS